MRLCRCAQITALFCLVQNLIHSDLFFSQFRRRQFRCISISVCSSGNVVSYIGDPFLCHIFIRHVCVNSLRQRLIYFRLKRGQLQHMCHSSLICRHRLQSFTVVRSKKCLRSFRRGCLLFFAQGDSQIFRIGLHNVIFLQGIHHSVTNRLAIRGSRPHQILTHKIFTKISSIHALHLGLLISQIKIHLRQRDRYSIHTCCFCRTVQSNPSGTARDCCRHSQQQSEKSRYFPFHNKYSS